MICGPNTATPVSTVSVNTAGTLSPKAAGTPNRPARVQVEPAVNVAPSTTPEMTRVGPERWMSLAIRPGTKSGVRVTPATVWYAANSRPSTVPSSHVPPQAVSAETSIIAANLRRPNKIMRGWRTLTTNAQVAMPMTIRNTTLLISAISIARYADPMKPPVRSEKLCISAHEATALTSTAAGTQAGGNASTSNPTTRASAVSAGIKRTNTTRGTATMAPLSATARSVFLMPWRPMS